MTKTHKERIEEVVEEFTDNYGRTSSNLLNDQSQLSEVCDYLRTPLLTLRRKWLEERVKKLEGMKKHSTGHVPKQVIDEEDGYNTALQTLIDADRKELEELSN